MSQRRAGPVALAPSGEEVLVGSRLGRLYLDQGHIDEAETIFRAVLRWQPDRSDARSGLEAARRQRKLARLRRYLERLRRAG